MPISIPTRCWVLAAAAERYSEHPLAVTGGAGRRNATRASAWRAPRFRRMPGIGVRARLDGKTVAVGGGGLLSGEAPPPISADLETQGKTLLFVIRNGRPVGVLAAMDTLRPDVPEALAELSRLGIKHLELLTGDNERTAAAIARRWAFTGAPTRCPRPPLGACAAIWSTEIIGPWFVAGATAERRGGASLLPAYRRELRAPKSAYIVVACHEKSICCG